MTKSPKRGQVFLIEWSFNPETTYCNFVFRQGSESLVEIGICELARKQWRGWVRIPNIFHKFQCFSFDSKSVKDFHDSDADVNILS